jgi:hypothetical protein
MRYGTRASSVSGSTSSSVSKAHLLNREILVQELQFLLERELLYGPRAHRQSKQVAQAHQHLVGCVDVLVHQRGDGMQRVEQEMGLQLVPERIKPRLDEAGLQTTLSERPLLCLAVVVDGVAQSHERPVDHHVPVTGAEDPIEQIVRRLHEQVVDQDHQRHVRDGVGKATGDMNCQRLVPRASSKLIPAAEIQHRRR